MSVKIKAKNDSDLLQTLRCDNTGILKTNSTLVNITLTNTETITASNNGNSINLTQYNKMRIWGTTNHHHNFYIQYSNDNITFYTMDEINVLSKNSILIFNSFLENIPKYIRFYNHHSSSINLVMFLELN